MNRILPVLTVLAAIVVIWYLGAVGLNMNWARQQLEREGVTATLPALIGNTMAQERPVLPAPHQVAQGLWDGIAGQKITSKRSLVWHGWVTLSATLAGFVIGSLTGILLAAGIVLWLVYGLLIHSWPLIGANTVTLALVAVILSMKLRYG